MSFALSLVMVPDLLPVVTRWANQLPDVSIDFAGNDLRGAAEHARIKPPDLLLVDDAVLRENPGWVSRLKELPGTLVVLGDAVPETFRRALAAGAADFVLRDHWESELPPVVERVMAQHAPAPHPVVAVFSPKGGVGKSTLAANLACAAGARLGESVALIDFDLQFGDLATLLGLEPRATVADATRLPTMTRESLSRLFATVDKTAVQLLASPVNPLEAEDISAERAVQLVEAVRRSHPVTVVDTALGYTDVNVAVLDTVDIILLVLTPDVVTVRSVARTLELLQNGFQYPSEKIRLVLNRDGSGLDRKEIIEALGRPIDFGLPSDGAWPVRAANEGTPLWTMHPQSQLIRAIDRIAVALFGRAVPARPRTKAAPRRPPLFPLVWRG